MTIKLLTILDGVEGGGRHQRSILDTQCRMTWRQWQTPGKASSTLNVAERKVVAGARGSILDVER